VFTRMLQYINKNAFYRKVKINNVLMCWSACLNLLSCQLAQLSMNAADNEPWSILLSPVIVTWFVLTPRGGKQCTPLAGHCGACEMRRFVVLVWCGTDDRYGEGSGTYGVVQSVQHSGRTCHVMWMKAQPSTELA